MPSQRASRSQQSQPREPKSTEGRSGAKVRAPPDPGDPPKRRSSKTKNQTWSENELLDQLSGTDKKSMKDFSQSKENTIGGNDTGAVSVPKKRPDETPEERAHRKKLEKLSKERQDRKTESHERRIETSNHKPDNRIEVPKKKAGETAEERAYRKKMEKAAKEAQRTHDLQQPVEHEKIEVPKKRAHETSEERAHRKKLEKAAAKELARRRQGDEGPEDGRDERKDTDAEMRAERKHHERREREKDAPRAGESSSSRQQQQETSQERRERKRVLDNRQPSPHSQLDRKSPADIREGRPHRDGDRVGDEEANDGVDEYEEDFYEYDEDFDEVNTTQESGGGGGGGSKEISPPPPDSARYFSQMSVMSYSFPSTRRRGASHDTRARMQKRSFALLNRIELDYLRADLFELAPLTEYDMYMRRFGGGTHTTQTACQTRLDDVHFSMQTEELERADCWCQQPPADLRTAGCGSVRWQSTEDEQLQQQQEKDNVQYAMVEDSRLRRLTDFVSRAGSLMCSLLATSDPFCGAAAAGRMRSYLQMADVFSELQLGASGFRVCCSDVRGEKMAVGLSREAAGGLASCSAEGPVQGLVAVGDVSTLSSVRWLASSSPVTCCAMDPGGAASVVVAGTSEGLLLLWDLLHDAARKPAEAAAATRGSLETYSTALFMRATSFPHSHKTRIVSVHTFGHSLSSFQMVSLDAAGVLIFWNCHSTAPAAAAGPSDQQQDAATDLTLLPGATVKFSQSFYCPLTRRCCEPPPTASAVCFLPGGDLSTCVAGFDDGGVQKVDCFAGGPQRPLARADRFSGVALLEPCPVAGCGLLAAAHSDGGGGGLSLLHEEHGRIGYHGLGGGAGERMVRLLWPADHPLLLLALSESALHVLSVPHFSRGALATSEVKGSSAVVDMQLWRGTKGGGGGGAVATVLALLFASGTVQLHELRLDDLHAAASASSGTPRGQLMELASRQLLPTAA